MRVAFVASEFAPLAKTGGLADVSSALARFLARRGVDLRAFMPLYARIDRRALALTPLESLRDVPLALGPHRYRFSVLSGKLPGSDLALNFIDCPVLYGRPDIYTRDPDEHLRFLLLTRAAIECCQRMGFAPDIFHAHDWHTAFAPLLLKSVYSWDRLFAATRTVLTIHNIGYQGVFGAAAQADLGLGAASHLLHQEDLAQGRINSLKHGVLFADAVTTVSPTYAREIQTPAYGCGLDGILRERHAVLSGILNGIDVEEWDPTTDPRLAAPFDALDLRGKARCKAALQEEAGLPVRADVPLLAVIARLVPQKGVDVFAETLDRILGWGAQVVMLGSGPPEAEAFFTARARELRDRFCGWFPFDDARAHRLQAGADFLVMPSRFEPCGLSQLYAMRYGTLPIVRQTGGLADTVTNYDEATGTGTGFVFRDLRADSLADTIGWAVSTWYDRPAHIEAMRLRAMAEDHSWNRAAQTYETLYLDAYARRRGHPFAPAVPALPRGTRVRLARA
jgi:starch synthase